MLQFSREKSIVLLLGLTIFLFVSTQPAVAQTVSDNFLEPIVDQYANNTAEWEAPLKGFAMSVFWLLVLIDVVWIGMILILQKSDFGEWALTVITQLITIGFFYALLNNSSQWAGTIIQSFRLAGDAANASGNGTVGIQPSDIFDSGVNIAVSFIKSFKIDKFSDSIAMGFASIIILISFALIAALQVVVLVESYIFTYAGILFLGFGGSRFTRDFAHRYLVGIVAVGAKLFVIQLITGLAVKMIAQWDTQIDVSQGLLDLGFVLRITGGSIVFLALSKMIPTMVQGMINGASYSSGAPLVSSSMAVANLGAATANGMGAVGGLGLGMLSSAVGLEGLAKKSYAFAGKSGSNTLRHASETMNHSFDTNTDSFRQYMPNPFQYGETAQTTSYFRGTEQGEDQKPENGNPPNIIGT
jgi:type IV secretion system protein TrbL